MAGLRRFFPILVAAALAGPMVPHAPARADWSDRLHLRAGAGMNFSTYSSRFLAEEVGSGLNLKTDLGVAFGERWALDFGSSLKFNLVEDLMLWDTLLTVGVRRHLGGDGRAGPFVRVFAGVAPSVLEVRDRAKATTDLGPTVDRLVFDGEVVGVSVGSASGLLGGGDFLEFTASLQTLRREKSIADEREIPVVVRTRLLNGDARILSFALVWGFHVF